MSLDHLLFRAPGPGPMSSWPAEEPPALGSCLEVRHRLEQLLSDLQWEQEQTRWFGRTGQGVEVQVTPEADDAVRFVTLRRAGRSEIERVCLALGLVAVDPGFSVYRPDTGRWEREA